MSQQHSVCLPEKRIEVKKNHNVNSISVVRTFFTAVAASFLLCVILFGKVEISKTFNEISKLDKQIAVLQSENIRLQTDFETKTSLSKVEDYAKNTLGLKKLDKSQIDYVEIQKENVVEVIGNNNKNPFVAVKNWFSNALEYIGV